MSMSNIDTINETIRAIKSDLRSAMNGVAAQSIRQSGMGYKLTFGVELPRLRAIAASYTPSSSLAQALWQENIRESKILAILLYPTEEFDASVADFWLESLPVQQAEIAQILCMERASSMPSAANQAFIWMADERPLFQLCGFLTITRLFMKNAVLSPDSEEEFLDQAAAAIGADFLPLRKAVVNAVLRFSDTSEEAQQKVEQMKFFSHLFGKDTNLA